jgi:hypothetical protein
VIFIVFPCFVHRELLHVAVCMFDWNRVRVKPFCCFFGLSWCNRGPNHRSRVPPATKVK